MDSNTITPTMAAAISSAHAGNRNLSTDPKRMAGESVGAAEREFDGAKLRHKLETSSMLAGLVRQGMKLEDFEWYLSFHEENEVALHSGAGVGMAHVAQFILGQTDIRDCVPFLINRENVI